MSESRHIAVAALFSLLLHALVLGLAVGGSSERTMAITLNDLKSVVARLNGETGEIAVLLVSEEGEAETPSPDTSFDLEKEDDGVLTSTAVTETAEPLSELKSPSDPSHSADSHSASPSGAATAVRHSIPLDAYRAQIKGRIERAWARPLANLKEAFRCEVQISQTPQGEVREVTLTDCDGDPAWRESLIRAIRYAAPLPAPPSEKAFRSVLTLNFQAEPLSPALLAQLLSVTQEVDAAAPPHDGANATGASVPVGNVRVADPHAR